MAAVNPSSRVAAANHMIPLLDESSELRSHRKHAVFVDGRSGTKVVPSAPPRRRVATIGTRKILASGEEEQGNGSEQRYPSAPAQEECRCHFRHAAVAWRDRQMAAWVR